MSAVTTATASGVTSSGVAAPTSATGDDHGDEAATATWVRVGQLTAGRIDHAADVDWFAIPLAAGDRYAFWVTNQRGGMSATLALHDPGAALIEEQSGRIQLVAPRDGTWFLAVRHTDPSFAAGDYDLMTMLDASTGPGAGAAPITTDTTPPQVDVTSPARGAFVSGTQVMVTGTATDPGGVDVLTINGAVVPVGPNGAFNEPLTLTPGLNVIDVEAIDRAGNATRSTRGLIAGQFLPDGQPVRDALAVRVNRPALEALGRLGLASLTRIDLRSTLQRHNPLFDGGIPDATLRLDARDVTFGAPTLQLEPRSNRLEVVLTLPRLTVTLDARGTVFGQPYQKTIQLVTTNSRALAVTEISIQNGRATTRMVSLQIALDGFGITIPGVSTQLLQTVGARIRLVMEQVLSTKIQDLLQVTLNRVVGSRLTVLRRSVLGQSVELQVAPKQLAVDRDGITLVVDGEAQVAVPQGTVLPVTSGSLATPGATPPLPKRGPALALALDDDLLNQVSHVAWRAGLLDMRIDTATALGHLGLPAFLQGLDVFLLRTLFPTQLAFLSPTDRVEIQVRAGLPPVFSTLPAPGLLELGLGELTVTVLVGGSPIFEVAIQLQAGLAVTALSTGALQVRVTGPPVVHTTVLQTFLPLDRTAIGHLVDTVLAPALLLLNQVWSTVPLPSPTGLTLQNPTITRVADHLVVGTDLR